MTVADTLGQDYLQCLAEDMGLEVDTVMEVDTLGENEDFDGLVTLLEDYRDGF